MEIAEQTKVFLWFTVYGFAMSFVYDVLAVKRMVFKIKKSLVAVEDIIFWISAAICFFILLLFTNSGSIRGFCVLGMIIGSVLYFQIVSRHFRKGGEIAAGYIIKGLNKAAGFIKPYRERLSSSFKKACSYFNVRIYMGAKWFRGLVSKRKRKKRPIKKTIRKPEKLFDKAKTM
jgi:spore cortex biosynthesis protein YabQ